MLTMMQMRVHLILPASCRCAYQDLRKDILITPNIYHKYLLISKVKTVLYLKNSNSSCKFSQSILIRIYPWRIGISALLDCTLYVYFAISFANA